MRSGGWCLGSEGRFFNSLPGTLNSYRVSYKSSFVLTAFFNLSDQVVKDKKVKRQAHAPVDFPKESFRAIVSIYGKPVFSALWFNAETEPCFSA